jgi:hypothetical protein
MTLTAVGLQVRQPSGRTDELLAGLAERLHKERLIPDANGHLFVMLDVPGPEAWTLVEGHLDALAPDWHEHLWLGQRPER